MITYSPPRPKPTAIKGGGGKLLMDILIKAAAAVPLPSYKRHPLTRPNIDTGAGGEEFIVVAV